MRLPPLTVLTPRQQEISDQIAAKRGATRGPFLIWLRSPELAEKVDALGARFGGDHDLTLIVEIVHKGGAHIRSARTGNAVGVLIVFQPGGIDGSGPVIRVGAIK